MPEACFIDPIMGAFKSQSSCDTAHRTFIGLRVWGLRQSFNWFSWISLFVKLKIFPPTSGACYKDQIKLCAKTSGILKQYFDSDISR